MEFAPDPGGGRPTVFVGRKIAGVTVGGFVLGEMGGLFLGEKDFLGKWVLGEKEENKKDILKDILKDANLKPQKTRGGAVPICATVLAAWGGEDRLRGGLIVLVCWSEFVTRFSGLN